MQNAIEFVATKKNNRLIEIPEEFIDEISGQFRVILLLDKTTQTPKSPKKELTALKVALNGYKFNRDDAYDE
jgi:hypothetical protein